MFGSLIGSLKIWLLSLFYSLKPFNLIIRGFILGIAMDNSCLF